MKKFFLLLGLMLGGCWANVFAAYYLHVYHEVQGMCNSYPDIVLNTERTEFKNEKVNGLATSYPPKSHTTLIFHKQGKSRTGEAKLFFENISNWCTFILSRNTGWTGRDIFSVEIIPRTGPKAGRGVKLDCIFKKENKNTGTLTLSSSC